MIRRLKLDEKIFDARKVMGEISRAKDNLITPRTFALEQRSDFTWGVLQTYTPCTKGNARK
ncbi:MAG: hypothetical protein ACLUB2_01385 [Butyricicoccus pullicaecorum]